MLIDKVTTPLGPARVQAVRGDRLELLMEDGPATATLALAAPYDPSVGDVVLVIGDEERYVIGVLKSQRRAVLSVPGDLDIKAGGRVRIHGETALELTSPQVTVRADRFETIAQASFQRFMNSYTWVKGVIQTTSGRLRTLVDQTATLQAGRIVEKAREDVSIDGQKIRLG